MAKEPVKNPAEDDDSIEFRWEDAEKDGEVIVQNQSAIAIYINPYKNIVLRQEGRYGSEDHIVAIPKSEVRKVIKKMQDLLKEI